MFPRKKAPAKPAKPVKVLQLKEGSIEVELIPDALAEISANLQSSGCTVVSIVSVMGGYRTGKSFLLDLMMRYLRRREVLAKQRAMEERRAAADAQAESPQSAVAEEGAERPVPKDGGQGAAGAHALAETAQPWKFGDEAIAETTPAWILEGDAARISEGSKSDESEAGFVWRPGKDRCTQGIWLWSHPFVFQDAAGRSVGVLLMDTQGAYDDKMAKAQSSTIFGLTALLSSKMIFNIQNRVEEDKLENLDYFTTFAQTVTCDHPGGSSPFGHLQLLVRDWSNYEDGFTLEECQSQMREHQDDHLDPQRVPEDARPRVERLASTFRSISTCGLPHPGLKVTRPAYNGEIQHFCSDFMHLLDAFFEQFFTEDFPRPSAPLGMEITVGSFVQVVTNFAEAFRENRDMAIGLREAFVKVEMMTAREDLLKRFRDALGREAPESAVVDPMRLSRATERLVKSYAAEFENKLKPWRLKQDEETKAVKDFQDTIKETARTRILANEKEVEGATMKLVVSPVVGGGMYFLLVHQYILYALLAVGTYLHLKKFSDRFQVDMLDRQVLDGVFEDVKKWSTQRWKDLQAMGVAVNRCTPDEAMNSLASATRQAGAMAASAAAAGGVAGSATTSTSGPQTNGAGAHK